MTSVEDKKLVEPAKEVQPESESDRPTKKLKAEEQEEKKPQETGTEQPKTEEKKIFGAGFTSKNPWAAASSPFSSLSTASTPVNVFGQGSTKVTFGSLAGSNGSAAPNVFASKSETSETGEKKELTSEALAPPSSWVSPFSSSSIFGAKTQKPEEKNEKQVEAPVSGEEHEMTDFTTRGKLYIFDSETKKDWRERGVGVFKLNTPLKGGPSRMVMRSDGNMRLILNANLYDGMLVELALEKAIRFLAIDPEHNNKMQTFLLRTRTKDDAKNLIREIKSKVKITERELPSQSLPSLSVGQSQSQDGAGKESQSEEKKEEDKEDKEDKEKGKKEEKEGEKAEESSSDDDDENPEDD